MVGLEDDRDDDAEGLDDDDDDDARTSPP